MTKVQEVTISRYRQPNRWYVWLGDKPFGEIWTFNRKGKVHPFYVKTLAGFYGEFETFDAAEAAIRGQM